jgi:hypothetical protein
VPNNRNDKNKRDIQPPPPKIFILDQLVQIQGVLGAALIGEIYFWIAKAELQQNKNPWKLNCNYASWFNKHERTIGRKLERLHSIGWLDRKRSRHPKGYLWGYTYTKANNQNSDIILNYYKSFIKNEFVTNDHGNFDPNDTDAKENPTFQMLHTSSIAELGDLDEAYVLDRLSWIFHSREDTQLSYRSYNHLSSALNMKPKKVIGIIHKLERKQLLSNSECVNGYRELKLCEDGKSYQRMSEYLYEHIEKRKAGELEQFLE